MKWTHLDVTVQRFFMLQKQKQNKKTKNTGNTHYGSARISTHHKTAMFTDFPFGHGAGSQHVKDTEHRNTIDRIQSKGA